MQQQEHGELFSGVWGGCGNHGSRGLFVFSSFPSGTISHSRDRRCESALRVRSCPRSPVLGGLPTCIPPEPRAPGLLRPLCSGAVRVNHCFLRRVLETRLCGGLDRAVSTQLPPQAWSPWWSRRSDRDRGAPSVFLASLLPGAYVSPEASFPPPRSWRCQGRRGRDSGNFLEVRW